MRLLRSVPLACFLLLLPLFAAWGVTFPVLSGPLAYIGQFEQENEAYAVLLILSEDRRFLLQERFVLPNGKKSSWEVAGKWIQTRGGSFLQLSNASHFSRQANVGGTGNLYMGIQLPTGSLVTVPLRPQSIDDHGQDLRRLASMDPSTLEAPSGQEQHSVAVNGGEEPTLPVAIPLHLRKKQAPTVAVTMTSWRNGEELVQRWKNTSRFGRGTNAAHLEGLVAGMPEQPEIFAVAEQLRRNVVQPAPFWKDGYLLSSVAEPRQGRGLVAVVPVVREEQQAPSLAAVEQPRQRMVLPAPSWKDEYMLAFVSPKSEMPPQVVTSVRQEQQEPLLVAMVEPEQSRGLVAVVPAVREEQSVPALTAEEQARQGVVLPVDSWKDEYTLTVVPSKSETLPEAVTPVRPEQQEPLLVVAEQPLQGVAQPAPFWEEDDELLPVDEFRESRGLVEALPVVWEEQATSAAAGEQPHQSVFAPTLLWKDRYMLSSVPQQRDTRKGKSRRQRVSPERQIMGNAWQGDGRPGIILRIHQPVRS
jgi:hypothetical protein